MYNDSEILEALLLEPTQAHAAALIGCDRSTIRRRCEDPEFNKKLRRLRKDRLEHICLQYERLAQIAALELEKILTDPDTPPNVKIQASNAILSLINRSKH